MEAKKTKKRARIGELEETLLDQIEKLNQDDILTEPDAAKALIERSKCMAALADSYVEVNRLKLDVVNAAVKAGGLYDGYLGLEAK